MPRRRLTEAEPPQLLSLAPASGLAERAAEAIVLGVASGALQPGQRLVEVELARLLQMSRVPLREALKILEAQGIVESTPHRGTHIATFDESRIDEICEGCVEKLHALRKPFKYMVTCVISQRTGSALHSAHSCYWDTVSDGVLSVMWPKRNDNNNTNQTMHCITTIYAVSFCPL